MTFQIKSRSRNSPSFWGRAVPFFFLMGAGCWGLSQFLKLPTQLKDENRKRKQQGREKFDLQKEHERLESQLKDERENYDYVRVPGPRPAGRVAAD